MNTLLIIGLVVGVALADVGIGYNYKAPEISYGVPSYQTGSRGDYNTGYAGGSAYNYNNAQSLGGYQGSDLGQLNVGYNTVRGSGAGGQYYQTGGLNSGSSGSGVGGQYYQISGSNSGLSGSGTGGQYYQTSGSSSGLSGSTLGFSQPSYQITGTGGQSGYQNFNNYQTSNQYQTSSQYKASAALKYQQFYNQWQQQPAQVFKHFYVHAAPEEPEPEVRQKVVLPPPQKHYKIIFIKAPTQRVYTPQYIPVPQPNEEKTIVYVLAKKPERPGEIVIPKPEQKPPTKPEVFFIKYNNKDDSQAVINNIVSDYNKGSSGNYATGYTGASGIAQTGSGLYTQNAGSGLYAQNTGSGLYAQNTGAGQYSQTTGSGQYGLSTAGYNGGLTSSQIEGSQVVNVPVPLQSTGAQIVSVTTDSGNNGGYDKGLTGSFSTTGTTGSSSSIGNYDTVNTISTSQGVPYETYGPPKFRS